jgi:hypothetical protein
LLKIALLRVDSPYNPRLEVVESLTELKARTHEVTFDEMIDAWLAYFREKFSNLVGQSPTGRTELCARLVSSRLRASRFTVCLRRHETRTACLLARLLTCLNVPVELALARHVTHRSLTFTLLSGSHSVLRRRASRSLAMHRYHTLHQPPRVAGAFLV